MTSKAANKIDYGEGLPVGARAPASYAASAIASRGRFFHEVACPTRSPFQRDRDRILHATAFRRLTYKTQVFLFHEGDHYRSRLTHSLEVAQIARTIARQLRLDEDLAEAVALAHDLGHSPFGHAGERALDRAMRDFGGFDHNAQSIRVVTSLERKYLAFDGLNLSWEMLEGLAKHNGPVRDLQSPVAKVVRRLETWKPLDLAKWASAEAQVASLADDIAYLSHDVDDGLRAGLLSLDALADVPVAGPLVREVIGVAKNAHDGRAFYEVTRRMITVMVADVVNETRRALAQLAPETADDIRSAGSATVAFSKMMASDMKALKSFLFERVYHHEKVMRVMKNAEQIVTDLLDRYRSLGEPTALPEAWTVAMRDLDARARARLSADYLAGQTDRYALAEHRRLFEVTPDLR
ncbi:MAG: deoxyguanosinetriphosphate triphosphohydrolase [Hyphomicrobium sp.]|nr:MAG: deoxyguanosinetriphosphate triphosphohydrolase [Hyphomicrobium sp.]